MIQVARGNISRIKGTHRASNFISRNRRAVRESRRSDRAGRGSGKGNTQQGKPSPAPRKEERNKGTVVVSKAYLDELLRSVAHGEGEGPKSHIVVDHSEVPGLAEIAPSRHSSHTVATHKENTPPKNTDPLLMTAGPLSHPSHSTEDHSKTLSKHDQWLCDLAQQAEEQKRKKETEREREKCAFVEDYNPWGRPGAGAPLRTSSGNLLTDFRRRGGAGERAEEGGRRRELENAQQNTVQPPVSTTSKLLAPPPDRHPAPGALAVDSSPSMQGTTSTSPQFARGAGPFVDQYMLEQKEQQRRKDREHMAFLQEQIAAKERQKREERLRREREEREEAEKVEAERERLKREYQMEMERAQRKEEQASQRQAQLQQRIAEAELAARRDKEEARMSRVPSLHRHTQATVHFHEPDHLSPARSSQDLLRSPSMLLVSGPEPTHADMQDTIQPQSIVHSSKQSMKPRDATQSDSSKAGNGQKKGSRQQQSEVKGRRRGTPSRIPVKQQTATRTMSKQTQPARRDPRAEQLPQPVLCDAPLCRMKSPPVPALAKKLGQGKNCSSNTTTIFPSLVRAKSPPVPALAKKLHPDLQTLRSHSPPVPALAKKLQPDSQTLRSNSPPVPALAGRLQQPDSETLRSHSPPVPTLAKKLQTVRTSSQLHLSPPTQPALPQVVEEAYSMPIDRPPSCTLTTTPLLPSLPSHTLASTTQNVVTIPPAPSSLPSQGSLPLAPMTTNRQQTILQQLETLRQGIMSQRMNLDHRVTGLLSRHTHIL